MFARHRLLSALLMMAFLVIAPDRALATSDFDSIIIKSNTLMLGNVDRTGTWFGDLKQYSNTHPADVALAHAVTSLHTSLYSGKGWALFICPDATCGGGGYGQIVITPPNEHYKFFTTTQGEQAFGVSADNYTLIHFRYAINGGMVDAGQGSTAVGVQTDGSDSRIYVGFKYYPNPSIMTRVVYINSTIDYPLDYGGQTIPQKDPAIFVAAGDSFSTGEGNPAFEAGSAEDGVNECHRSPQAYPRLVQNALNLGSTAFVACSGATTNDVLGIPEADNLHGKWNEPAQINALSDETEVVTITIGGNDVGFGNFGYECLFPVNLIHGTCDEFTDIYKETVWKINNELADKVENVYGALLNEAPNADIYVLGYPHIAPYKTIEDVFDQDCGGLYDEFPNNWGDARAAHEITNLLNEVIEDAVIATNTQYSTDRLQFVSVDEGAFAGHDACSDDSYFHGIVVPDTEYSVHPSVNGQAAYAADLAGAMS